MAITDITKPMALDETLQGTNTALGNLNTTNGSLVKDASLNTTETTPRNIADVLADELGRITNLLKPDAEDVDYNNTESGLTSTNVQDAIDELESSKADKVSSATNGNLAGLDSNGNLTDSGISGAYINILTNRKVVIIADSYGMRNQTNFLSILKTKLPNVYDGVGMSGYGYTNGTFEDEFDDFIENYTTEQKMSVTDIIFCGGWNDAREITAGRQTASSLVSAIENVYAHVINICPNAKVYSCFMGWHSGASQQNQVTNESLITAMKCYEGAKGNRLSALCDCKFIMRDMMNMDDSLFHPNATGASYLADAIHTSLFGGSYHYFSAFQKSKDQLSDVGIISNIDPFKLYIRISDGITIIKSEPINLNGTASGGIIFTFKLQEQLLCQPNTNTAAIIWGIFRGTINGNTYTLTPVYVYYYGYNGKVLLVTPEGQVASSVNGYLSFNDTLDNTKYT